MEAQSRDTLDTTQMKSTVDHTTLTPVKTLLQSTTLNYLNHPPV